METYNGWSNRETWLINLHYNLEKKSDIDGIKEDWEEKMEILRRENLIIADFVYDECIDWKELEDSLIDDDE